jgi:hypothetical protein
MMHSGYEATTVDYAFGSWKGFAGMVKATLFWRYPDPEAARMLESEKPKPALVNIDLAKSGRDNFQGLRVSGDKLGEGVERAFDYRGDLTIRLKDGRELVGYVFDRETGASAVQGRLRMLLSSSGERVTVACSDIDELIFSGRDMAAGKSWEAWVTKYLARKAAGEKNIELVPEAMD